MNHDFSTAKPKCRMQKTIFLIHRKSTISTISMVIFGNGADFSQKTQSCRTSGIDSCVYLHVEHVCCDFLSRRLCLFTSSDYSLANHRYDEITVCVLTVFRSIRPQYKVNHYNKSIQSNTKYPFH